MLMRRDITKREWRHPTNCRCRCHLKGEASRLGLLAITECFVCGYVNTKIRNSSFKNLCPAEMRKGETMISLFAVVCENGSLFVYAGDKAVYVNQAHAKQVADRADTENRKVCHCDHHKVVCYKPVRQEAR